MKARYRSHHSSVQHQEIEHFSTLADSWWDENGPMRALHRINPARLSFVTQQLRGQFGDSAPKGLKILDLGCGAGIATEPLARLGATMTGMDASAAAITAAKAHASSQNLSIRYLCGALEEHPEAYDVILALEVLEHVAYPHGLIHAIADRIRPGGMAIFSTLNRNWQGMMLGIVAAEYILNWVPPGTHDWRQFIKPAELASDARHAGLLPTNFAGIRYRLLQQEFQLVPHDTGLNYLMAAIKPASG